jgi:integrase
MLLSDLIENCYHHNQQIGKLKWARETFRVWKANLLPNLGDIPADTLTTTLQRSYRDKRTSQGAAPASVNRELQILRRAYKLALQHEPPLIKRAPYFVMATVDNARKVFIDLETLQRLRQAAEKHSPQMRCAVEIAYTYGWRRNEIVSVRRHDIDFFDGTIRLQTSKNKEPREVPITSTIRPLLEACCNGLSASDRVIANSVYTFSHRWRKVREAAGADHFIFHDYRRTSAKAKRSAGVPTSVIMELQGWKTEAMFRRYAIVDRKDKIEALRLQEEWEREKLK